MVNHFPAFAKTVAQSFQNITNRAEVYVVDVDGDKLFAEYLAAFPEGTNPLFVERTEHDCSCCKQFIRRAGHVVAIGDNGGLVTVWDEAAATAPEFYKEVAKKLRNIIAEHAICDLFRTTDKEPSFGAEVNRSVDKVTGNVRAWNHFYTGPIAKKLRVALPDQVRGEYRTTVQVFERGLKELQPEAIDTVLDMIDSNSIYRGAEHRDAVIAFRNAQNGYMAAENKSDFVWANARGKASRFRNNVIGTLVTELSEGVDVEKAVAAFESKVAPHNYKRTSAVITPAMVKKAMTTIADLGLDSALERRFARIEDISVNDVLWVDSTVKPKMKGGLGDVLMEHATARVDVSGDEDKAEDIAIDAFLKNVLPEATGIEVLFKGQHLGNLMSLTAPVHPEPKQLFRWGNDFAWSYTGNITDSIKERVKRAGGNVTNAQLRVSLSWWNTDDLDIHVIEPGGNEIYFGNKRGRLSGGELDVDMNAHTTVRDPVENVSWVRVPDGPYKVYVNNYNKRESSNEGFIIEVENGGKLSHYNYDKSVRSRETIEVMVLHMKNGAVTKVDVGGSITTTTASQERWGLSTESYARVNAVTLSPNYWHTGNAAGNKHTFFILDGCKNDEPTRGIYNEFLHPRLEEHRKVFEVIGEKTKCQPTDGQLSGLGFSSTKKDNVIVKVTQGKNRRLFNVKFNTGA